MARAAGRLERGRAEVRILIEDEGPGFLRIQERVFEPFVRLEVALRRDRRHRPRAGDRALDLRAHGGDIRFSIAPGGLRHLTLPRPTGR